MTQTPDPEQAATIARLEHSLAAAQGRIESLIAAGSAKADLQQIETEKRAAEKQLAEIQRALLAATAHRDDQTMFRAAVGKWVTDASKRFGPTLSEWQRIAERPHSSLNIMLYHDVQAFAAQLETVATGLRLLALDPQAAKKRAQSGAVITTTATATATEGGMDHAEPNALPE